MNVDGDATPDVVVILGPTAVGKSWLGLELASRLGGEIVNADALQVYRGFDLGTAKPTAEDQRWVPHHLIDILEPTESYSAGEFARQARSAVAEIRSRQRIPLILGGSGLYVRALIDGISPIPPTSPEVRQRLRQRLENEGLENLRQELTELDGATASRLGAGDTQRILRALEVALSTGRPLSSWVAESPKGSGGLAAVRIGLTLPRDVLYDRIAARVHSMIGDGWVAEVEHLLGRGIDPGLTPFQAIGYRQLVSHVAGDTSLDEAVAATIQATKRYAKRQMTWFRKEPEVTWFSMEESSRCLEAVIGFLAEQRIGGGNGQT